MMTAQSTFPEQSFEPDLLIRPPLCRNEGPHGYLFRLAEANSMTVSELQKIGGSFDIAWLARNRLIPVADKQSELYTHAVWMSRLLRENKEVWNHRRARYCPLCLIGDPNWRAGWELLFYDACPEHGMWLIDLCSICNSPLRWKRDHLLHCQCGADLRHSTATAAPNSVVRLASVLESRALKQQVMADDSPLSEMGIEHIQRLVRYLGCHMNPAAGLKPLKVLDAASMRTSWPVSSLAAEILAQWPSAFYSCWSQLQKYSAGEKAGLSAVLKQAYYYLYKGLSDEKFDPMRVAFEAWLLEEWQGGISKRNRRLEEQILRQAKWISVGEAAREISVSVSRLKSLVDDSYIEGKEFISESKRRFLMVRRDQLDQITELLEDEITMDAAMMMLGVGKLRMRKIFHRIFPSASRSSNQGSWRVSKQEVEAIIDSPGKLPWVSKPKTYQVPLANVLKAWRWETETIALLIESVKAKKVIPVSRLTTDDGITGWVFDSTELRNWHAELSSPDKDWLTIAEVAKLLGIHEQSAYWLARNRYLQCENVEAGKGHRYQVSAEAVEATKTRVVFATELADTLGYAPRKIIKALAERGIHPLQPRDTSSACRQAVYSRCRRIKLFVHEVKGKGGRRLNLA